MRPAAVLAANLRRIARQVQRTEAVFEKEKLLIIGHQSRKRTEGRVDKGARPLARFKSAEPVLVRHAVVDSDVLNALRKVVAHFRHLRLLARSDSRMRLPRNEQTNASHGTQPAKRTGDRIQTSAIQRGTADAWTAHLTEVLLAFGRKCRPLPNEVEGPVVLSQVFKRVDQRGGHGLPGRWVTHGNRNVNSATPKSRAVASAGISRRRSVR